MTSANIAGASLTPGIRSLQPRNVNKINSIPKTPEEPKPAGCDSTRMQLKALLRAIVAVSEKAAVLARAVRSEHSLFELLIEEKTSETKNQRFVHDFKTLADVLVQELVKYELSRQFPGIQESIFGEESNKFTNTLGESVTVEIKENPEEMTELLSLVLDGNEKASNLLTRVIHCSRGGVSHKEGRVTHSGGGVSLSEGEVTHIGGGVSHTAGGVKHSGGGVAHTEGGATHSGGRVSHTEGGATHSGGGVSHSEGGVTQSEGRVPQTQEDELQKIHAAVPEHLSIDIRNIGIWIDPIDSTAQYIHGYSSEVSKSGVYSEGLQCAVILIGAYNTQSGEPILGVVNQPFSTHKHTEWSGRPVWGLSYDGVNVSNVTSELQTSNPDHSAVVRPADDQGMQPQDTSTRTCAVPNTSEEISTVVQPANNNGIEPRDTSVKASVILSTSEEEALQSNLAASFQLVYAAGAGYKQLCVVDHLVAAYILSRGSTFKWDTCAPHAILKSLGGGIVDFTKLMDFVKGSKASGSELALEIKRFELEYHRVDREGLREAEKWSNTGGIIAYVNPHIVIDIAKSLLV